MPITGLVRRIAIHTTASSALPTLAVEGANTTWSAWTYTFGGRVGDSDDAMLDEDSISITPVYESHEYNPPLAQHRLDETVFKDGIDTVTFGVFNMKADESLIVSSTAKLTEAGGPPITSRKITSAIADFAYRALAVEIAGTGVWYFPKVSLRVTGVEAGVKDNDAALTFEAKVFGTTAVPAGYEYHEYLPAAE